MCVLWIDPRSELDPECGIYTKANFHWDLIKTNSLHGSSWRGWLLKHETGPHDWGVHAKTEWGLGRDAGFAVLRGGQGKTSQSDWAEESPGILWVGRVGSVGLGFCISDRFSGDAGDPGPQTTLWVAMVRWSLGPLRTLTFCEWIYGGCLQALNQ